MKLKKVSYVYSEGDAFEKKALDEISLEIPDGQFIGIIGHTGSGKSTLIQHLNGLLRATSGAIYYDGENIYQEGYDMRTLRSKVGLVFQYPEHQLFEVDVFSDVCFGPKNLGLSKEEVEERAKKALTQVGLDESYYKKSQGLWDWYFSRYENVWKRDCAADCRNGGRNGSQTDGFQVFHAKRHGYPQKRH